MNKQLTIKVICFILSGFICSTVRSGIISKEKKEYNLKVGEEFSLSLPANPTTGYSWGMFVNQPPQKRWIELVDSKYTQDEPGRMGGGGTISFTFKAVTPTDSASYAIPLYYSKPSSGDLAKMFSLIVTISPQ